MTKNVSESMSKLFSKSNLKNILPHILTIWSQSTLHYSNTICSSLRNIKEANALPTSPKGLKLCPIERRPFGPFFLRGGVHNKTIEYKQNLCLKRY